VRCPLILLRDASYNPAASGVLNGSVRIVHDSLCRVHQRGSHVSKDGPQSEDSTRAKGNAEISGSEQGPPNAFCEHITKP
jgi:hypothetical protein